MRAVATLPYPVIRNAFWVPLRMGTCALNHITGGPLHEPFCSRVWRCWVRGTYPRWFWSILYRAIDTTFFLFDPDHCWQQYVKTKKRQTPDIWSITWLWQTF